MEGRALTSGLAPVMRWPHELKSLSHGDNERSYRHPFFGGTGVLGRRIVRHLRDRELPVQIASKHPDRRHRQFGPGDPQLRSVQADIRDERSVAGALAAVEPWFASLARAQESGAAPKRQSHRGGRVHVVPSTKETVQLGVFDTNLAPILTIDSGDAISFPDT